MGCHFHGCRRCYDLTTHNTHLKRSMGDLYRESIRWIKRVTNNGYKLSVVWECDWDRMVKKSPDIQEHLESYSLSTPLLPRDCLYGGRCETFTLHAVECDESVIKYVDVQSLYPYVCKNKHYPVGHPQCLMGPNLTGMNFTEFEGPVKCKVLPPRGLMIPILPSHINGKFMFVLCKKCAETESSTPCGHSDNDRSLTGTWISVELQKAVSVGYNILKVYEVWQYDTTTVFDSATGDGGLFAMYMNTFIAYVTGRNDTEVYRSYFIHSVNQMKLQYINKQSSMSDIIMNNTGIGIIKIRMIIFSLFYATIM